MGASETKEARNDHGERPRANDPTSHTPTKPVATSQPGSPAARGRPEAAGLGAGSAGSARGGLSTVSLRAKQANCTNATDGVGTVVRWPGEAKRVIVEGTFTNWGKGAVALQRSASEHVAMLYLQPGEHAFRFIVDGVERIDPAQSKIEHEKGEFNTITVTEGGLRGDGDKGVVAQTGGTRVYSQAQPHEKEAYSQTRWVFEETRKLPPLFPPHLRYTPLTTPPEPRPTKEQALPAPYHVTINHMYFQSRDDYNVVGGTYRYANTDRYTTVVYYTSQEHGNMPPVAPSPKTSSSQPIHIDPMRH